MRGASENIVGYNVDTLGVQGCVGDIMSWIRIGSAENLSGCRWLACMNPHSYVVALKDKAFSTALHTADWLIPDGVGVVLASRLLDGEIGERVTGSDIFQGVHKELERLGGHSVFFLGSTEETLAEIRLRMAADFPNIRVAGTYSPPFKPVYSQAELDEMVAVVNDAAPDVLWVGMTAPKQEKWLHAVSSRLNVKFAAAIGAVFDFYTGRIKRSPMIFQHLGLEWLPRLVQEPKRLWRRTFVSAPIFIWHAIRQKLGIFAKPL